MKLVKFDSNKSNLTPMSFLNDLQNQTKIRDIDVNGADFKNQLAIVFTKVNNLLGIKESILDVNKIDIKELILMRFKGLTLEEIDYAFKLERFGSLGTKTEHFQLFNSDYVSKVLDKYAQWKVSKKKQFNLKSEQKVLAMSDAEKRKHIVSALTNQFNYFLEHRECDKTRIYVYDILDNKGLMPIDLDYKNEIKKDAINMLKSDFSNKKSTTIEEHKYIKSVIENLTQNKNITELKFKCKELALLDFMIKEIKFKSDIDRIISHI